MPLLDEFQYANTVRGITERIAHQMGDSEPGSEYEGLGETWIRARVFDTFKWLQGRRPELFSRSVTFPLQPSMRQELPEECDKILEIHTVDVGGKEYPVYDSDYKALRASLAYSSLQTCSFGGTYHAAIDENNQDSFLFLPIAHGAQVTATCSDMGHYFNDPDVELNTDACKWINTVVEYVMFVALSMDGGSQVSTTLSEQHRSTFFDLAPVQRRETSDR